MTLHFVHFKCVHPVQNRIRFICPFYKVLSMRICRQHIERNEKNDRKRIYEQNIEHSLVLKKLTASSYIFPSFSPFRLLVMIDLVIL